MRFIIAMVLASLLIPVVHFSCERANMDTFATDAPRTSAVYIFRAGNYMGNFGGRLGADLLCRTAWQNNFSHFSGIGVVRAFLSGGPLDPIIYTVPSDYWLVPVVGIGPAGSTGLLSETWVGMFEKGVNIPLEGPLEMTGMWWSGSLSSGYHEYGQDCNGWTDSAVTGEAGNMTINSDPTWITASIMGCNNLYNLLCVAY